MSGILSIYHTIHVRDIYHTMGGIYHKMSNIYHTIPWLVLQST